MSFCLSVCLPVCVYAIMRVCDYACVCVCDLLWFYICICIRSVFLLYAMYVCMSFVLIFLLCLGLPLPRPHKEVGDGESRRWSQDVVDSCHSPLPRCRCFLQPGCAIEQDVLCLHSDPLSIAHHGSTCSCVEGFWWCADDSLLVNSWNFWTEVRQGQIWWCLHCEASGFGNIPS